MILGWHEDHHPRVTIQLPSESGLVEVEVIVDTGFDGDLTLPIFLLRRAAASRAFTTLRSMADGSLSECDVYLLSIEWNGEIRRAEVLNFEHNPLLGTNLLEGCSLRVHLEPGGEVVIEFPD